MAIRLTLEELNPTLKNSYPRPSLKGFVRSYPGTPRAWDQGRISGNFRNVFLSDGFFSSGVEALSSSSSSSLMRWSPERERKVEEEGRGPKNWIREGRGRGDKRRRQHLSSRSHEVRFVQNNPWDGRSQKARSPRH